MPFNSFLYAKVLSVLLQPTDYVSRRTVVDSKVNCSTMARDNTGIGKPKLDGPGSFLQENVSSVEGVVLCLNFQKSKSLAQLELPLFRTAAKLW